MRKRERRKMREVGVGKEEGMRGIEKGEDEVEEEKW